LGSRGSCMGSYVHVIDRPNCCEVPADLAISSSKHHQGT
jgi:hypothetical protein